MPETAAITFGAYQRTGNPTTVSLNTYIEAVQTPSGERLQERARPGLENFKTVGSGPIRGIYQRAGLFSDAALVVSATAVYTLSAAGVATALTGTVAGDDVVDIAMGQDADLNSVARIATGSALYKVQGDLVTLEDFPEAGGAGASSVAFIAGNWIAQEAGTDVFYFQIPGATTWAALSFASAEYAPDPGVSVRTVGELTVFLNSNTAEVWGLTGTAALPIEPYGGLKFDFGCRSGPSAVNCQGSLLWVDNNCQVRMFEGGQPKIVSDAGLAELIRQVDPMDLRAWTFSTDGHLFYVLRLGANSTWVYDLSRSSWTTFASLGYDYWRAHLGCSIGDTVLAADSISAQIYRLDPDRRTDGDDEIIKEFSAIQEGGDFPQAAANYVLQCDLGNVPRTGQGSEPLVGLCWSDNQGKTYNAYKYRPLGATGHYGTFPRWNGCGTVPAVSGRILRFRVSDPVSFVAKRVLANIA